MSPTLTDEQLRALEASPGEVVRLVDPRTKRAYVLLRAEVYDQVKGLLGEDFHPAEAYPAIDRAFAEGWEAPGMDDYDRYEELRP